MTRESEAREAAARLADPVVWSDVENGAYAADLTLWVELAESAGGPVLELGCGSGRVALHLARQGFSVLGVDVDPRLIEVVNARAAAEGLDVEAVTADARELDLVRRFKLVIAPMQLAHLLATRDDRRTMLSSIAGVLKPGGLVVFAVLDEDAALASNYAGGVELLPDVLESDGWLHSSLPIEVRPGPDGGLDVLRTRQVVSPGGEIAEAPWVERLARVDPGELAAAGAAAGLRNAQRRTIPSTEAHVGSTVLLLS